MHNGCVLAGGVGTGKTMTSLAYYVTKVLGGTLDRSTEVKTPKNILIITTARKRDEKDWESEAVYFGLFVEPELSYSKSTIVVDSWQNCKKYVDLEDWFVIWDEQGASGSGKWGKSFNKINAKNQWIMLSATPADTWIDYINLFISNGFYKNRTAFMDEHVHWVYKGKYPQIKGFYGVRKLREQRDRILVEMPYLRHTTRHIIPLEVDYDKDEFTRVWIKRWNVFEEVPLIDVAEMHRVGRKVVNSDPSRLNVIRELWEKHPRMIIWYSFDYELERLRTLCEPLGDGVGASLSLVRGMDEPEIREWNGHKHEPLPTSDRWLYLVQYQAGAEAWNCTTTDAMVYYSLTYSHKTFEQSQGRIDRLDTPFSDLYYYVLKSRSRIDQLIWKALEMKKDFHEGRNTKFDRAA